MIVQRLLKMGWLLPPDPRQEVFHVVSGKKDITACEGSKDNCKVGEKNRREYGILWEKLQEEFQKIVKGRKN